jgi:acetoin utilization deacetylase AcuC-like enzyme
MIAVTLDPVEDGHRTGFGHPEQPARLVAARRGLDQVLALSEGKALPSRPALRIELAGVHDVAYLDALADMCQGGAGELDADTPISTGSWETALLSAGAGVVAAEAMLGTGERTAFVLTRPPGHHAGRSSGMGFCLLNNVAVTAEWLRQSGERVAIFDWDVHHGNGTQEIFWNEPDVLFASVHQWPLYPGTGPASDRGAGSAAGTTINIPLPPGSTGDVYLAAFDEIVGPAIERFDPTWILVSAGFDAHRDDPLGDMGLSAGDFALLTTRAKAVCGLRRRLVMFLEGGYDLRALQNCVAACAAELSGLSAAAELSTEALTNGGPGRQFVTDWHLQAKEAFG